METLRLVLASLYDSPYRATEQVEAAAINYAYARSLPPPPSPCRSQQPSTPRLHYAQSPGVRHQAALVLHVALLPPKCCGS